MTEAHRTVFTTTDLRAAFAERLSVLYGREVPAYNTLVETSQAVNEKVLHAQGADAERFGTIGRVTAERHGAIRVGSPQEMAQVARIFAALGMYPCGFYDLRDAYPEPIPVISTAFRPLDRAELAANPFRVFTSLLVPEDRRFFDQDLQERLTNFLSRRTLFPGELLLLADAASTHGELSAQDAERFLDLTAACFALSSDPVDRNWYMELERISSVAADIGGVTTTHINHLTPRVLDIDDLYRSMQERGIAMIGQIQGPPQWNGPDVLLRQTSFRALAEPRNFREADGRVTEGDLRVRFGEVEARGIALTGAGRDLYDKLTAQVDRRVAEGVDGASRQDVAAEVWADGMPDTEEALRQQGLAHFTYSARTGTDGAIDSTIETAIEQGDIDTLVQRGLLTTTPIVYEDFLPRSAAGIFASNLSDSSSVTMTEGVGRDIDWMSGVVNAEVRVPETLYERESQASLGEALKELRRSSGNRTALSP